MPRHLSSTAAYLPMYAAVLRLFRNNNGILIPKRGIKTFNIAYNLTNFSIRDVFFLQILYLSQLTLLMNRLPILYS